jgi:hypothetical protein
MSMGTVSGLDVPLAQQRVQAADTGGDDAGEPFAVDRVVVAEAETGVGPRLGPRDHGQLSDPVEPAGLDPIQHRRRIDRRRGRDLAGQFVGPRLSDQAHARPAREHGVPGAGHVTAERRGRAEAGDDDRLSVRHWFSWAISSSPGVGAAKCQGATGRARWPPRGQEAARSM